MLTDLLKQNGVFQQDAWFTNIKAIKSWNDTFGNENNDGGESHNKNTEI